MIRCALLAAALFFASTARAETPPPLKQFDLACQRHDVDNPRKTYRPERFRIDLDAKTWCVNECEKTHPLTLTPDELVLANEADAQNEGKSEFSTSAKINRRSARYTFDILIHGKVRSRTEAQCELKPYSGVNAKPLF